MTILQIIFSTIAVISALFVVLSPHPVYSALALVVTFFAMASIWITLQAEFLSLILLLVYVGAVMTLFLFVIMMFNMTHRKESASFRLWYRLFSIIVMLCTIGLLCIAWMNPTSKVAIDSSLVVAHTELDLKGLGMTLFTDYAYPCEVAGVILLLAMVAAIALTYVAPIRRKRQSVDSQIHTHPQDRIRLVKTE